MITSHLGGGVFFGISFQNGSKRNTPKKISVSQQAYCFDFDDVDIKSYVLWDAEAMCEVIGEVRGEVMLT